MSGLGMRGEPFTSCRLRRVGGERIPAGAFLRAATSGSRARRFTAPAGHVAGIQARGELRDEFR